MDALADNKGTTINMLQRDLDFGPNTEKLVVKTLITGDTSYGNNTNLHFEYRLKEKSQRRNVVKSTKKSVLKLIYSTIPIPNHCYHKKLKITDECLLKYEFLERWLRWLLTMR